MRWLWFLVSELCGKSDLAAGGRMVNNATGDSLCLLFGLTHFRQKCVRGCPSGCEVARRMSGRYRGGARVPGDDAQRPGACPG